MKISQKGVTSALSNMTQKIGLTASNFSLDRVRIKVTNNHSYKETKEFCQLSWLGKDLKNFKIELISFLLLSGSDAGEDDEVINAERNCHGPRLWLILGACWVYWEKRPDADNIDGGLTALGSARRFPPPTWVEPWQQNLILPQKLN